jgi:hypothetical protein
MNKNAALALGRRMAKPEVNTAGAAARGEKPV